MIKNHLTIAFRNIIRQKGTTAINVVGLAVGMACFLTIGLFVRDELAYDQHHVSADQVYRVGFESNYAGAVSRYAANSPMGLASTLEARYPEVEESLVIRKMVDDLIVSHGGTYLTRGGVYGAGTSIFDIFTLPFVEGDPESALARPGTMVITESAAASYFADTSPVGKIITTRFGSNSTEYEITGVIRDIPRQSHFDFDFLASNGSTGAGSTDVSWSRTFGATYIKLARGTSPEIFEEKLAQLVSETGGEPNQLFLQPLTDIHLRSHMQDEFEVNGNIQYIYIFSIVAILILFAASVNFTNLSTAQAMRRCKEVGIRKALGANRRQLLVQFYGESLAVALVSLIPALILIEFAIPLLNSLLNKEVTLILAQDWWFLATTFGLSLLVGIAAGTYGAILMSGFRPDAALRGSLQTGSIHGTMRRVLITAQFTISVALIMSTLVMNSQLEFIQSQPMGFNEEQVVAVEARSLPKENLSAFKQELSRHTGVVAVTASNWLPGEDRRPSGTDDEGNTFIIVNADADFFPAMGFELKKGEFFGSDSNESSGLGSPGVVVVNETLVSILALDPDSVIGQKVSIPGAGSPTVIGIVDDFHVTSFHHEIAPVAFRLSAAPTWPKVMVRIRPESARETLDHIESVWSAFAPGEPVKLVFLDEYIQNLYASEQRSADLFRLLAGLAIFIGCLGLMGLVSFATSQRTKEIGIRKVLGASVSGLVVMLSKEFVRLVLIAFVLAAPLAYYAMDNWLSSFAYRIDIGPGIFVLSGALALLVALGTVSWQAIRAATADPVKSLRYE